MDITQLRLLPLLAANVPHAYVAVEQLIAHALETVFLFARDTSNFFVSLCHQTFTTRTETHIFTFFELVFDVFILR